MGVVLGVLIFFSLITPVPLPIAYGNPKSEVESFTDNRDGTSTLTVRCFDDRLVTFTVKTKNIKNMDVDAIFALIKKECYKFYDEGK